MKKPIKRLSVYTALEYANEVKWDQSKDGVKTYLRAQCVARQLPHWVNMVTPSSLREFVAHHPHLSPSTINRYIAAFRGAISICHKHGLCGPPPAWEALREAPPRDFVPTEVMVDGVVGSLYRRSYTQAARCVQVLADTGLRFSEYTKLEESDLTQDGDAWWISVVDAKNGKNRSVPVGYKPPLASLQLSYSYVRAALTEAVKALNYPQEFTLHSLRHYRASKLSDMGVPMATISELLGHSSMTTTARYVHPSRESLLKSVVSDGEEHRRSVWDLLRKAKGVTADAHFAAVRDEALWEYGASIAQRRRADV